LLIDLIAMKIDRIMELEERENDMMTKAFPRHLADQLSHDEHMYQFRLTNRMDNCSINHYQLRHLLWAPSNRGVFFPCKQWPLVGSHCIDLNRIRWWNPAINKTRVFMNLNDAENAFSRISAIYACAKFIAVGGKDAASAIETRIDLRLYGGAVI
jgi:hypothetical protein